jgi:hypothetical protein
VDDIGIEGADLTTEGGDEARSATEPTVEGRELDDARFEDVGVGGAAEGDADLCPGLAQHGGEILHAALHAAMAAGGEDEEHLHGHRH